MSCFRIIAKKIGEMSVYANRIGGMRVYASFVCTIVETFFFNHKGGKFYTKDGKRIIVRH